MVHLTRHVAAGLFRAAEKARLPDAVIRLGIDRIVAARLANERSRDPAERERFWDRAWEGPVAVHTDLANEQHYEVPAPFFDLVLGPHLKYSAAWWPAGTADLAAAEEAMLALTAKRTGLADGQTVLDLGCGWGSLCLWAAERYPGSRFYAVSNSSSQRERIETEAHRRQLSNVEALTADVDEFDPGRRFDRIVSVEMLEHVRNHRELLRRMREWIEPDGAVFVHVFAHRRYSYPFETSGPASWMARTFFTGGVMPSRSLIPRAAAPFFDLADDWWIDGSHYRRTLDAWLESLDAHADEVRAVLAPVYGSATDEWVQRWRLFFMACSRMFGYDHGREWGVAHHRLVPRREDAFTR